MYYTNCRGCTVNTSTCAHRAKIRESLAGLGLTSIKFKCPDRKPQFSRGNRVLVTWTLVGRPYQTSEGYDYANEVVSFKATVIEEKKPGRFLIRVDDGASHDCGDDFVAPDCLSGNGFASVGFQKLQSLNEFNKRVCDLCNSPNMADCWNSSVGLSRDCMKKNVELAAAE